VTMLSKMESSDSSSLNDRFDEHVQASPDNSWSNQEAGSQMSGCSNQLGLSFKTKLNKYSNCYHAKPQQVEPLYSTFAEEPVIVCGPEYDTDYTYFLVDGHPDFKNLERPISVNEFLAADEPINVQQQAMEHRVILKTTMHKDHANNFFISSHSLFFKLNRHKDVLPYRHSRVILSRPAFVSSSASEGEADESDVHEGLNEEKILQTYVSASFINSQVRDYGKAFIAAQAPEATSVAAFLQMVWENNVQLIVMLCQQESDSSMECIWYWAPQYQQDSHNIIVKDCVETQVTFPGGSQITKRILTLTDRKTEKQIEQLMFSSWKDRRAVEEDKLECLEHIIKRGLEVRENPDHKILVHCSAGIGRTGTYIAILLMIESLMYQVRELKREPHLSIFGTVRRLREQRYNTVTQEVQYKFLYTYMRRWI
jgi:protein tyrosine phosphatase